MRLYLDTSPVIYVVEQVPDFSQKILHYIQKPERWKGFEAMLKVERGFLYIDVVSQKLLV